MKIRTRLLLFLLPLFGGALVFTFLFPSILAIALTLIVMAISLFMIASRISRPVRELNKAALAIAAGRYGKEIEINGPLEITELSNTLSTMSECLYENLNREKENSLLRERMYGEYECALLLQHLMLQKNINDCKSDAFAVQAISHFSETPRGLLLDFPKNNLIHLIEAEEEGFEGMYQLLTEYKLTKDSDRLTTIALGEPLAIKGPHTPLAWRGSLIDPKEAVSGDYLFLYNRDFPLNAEALISKVLRIFGEDGIETVATMLKKEILFSIKRKKLEADLHLIVLQLL